MKNSTDTTCKECLDNADFFQRITKEHDEALKFIQMLVDGAEGRLADTDPAMQEDDYVLHMAKAILNKSGGIK